MEVQHYSQVKEKSLGRSFWGCRGKEKSGSFHSLIIKSITYRSGEVRTSLIARTEIQLEFL